MFRISIALPLIALTLGACASLPPPPSQCQRVELDPAPPWTASVTWAPGEEELVLVDPGSGELAAYGRDGRRRHSAEIATTAGVDMSHPLRFERDGSGFALVDRHQVLYLDRDLVLEETLEPATALEASEISGISLNDAVLHRGRLFGYADFIEKDPDPNDNPEAEGTWHRGFVRLDPKRGELEPLFELPIEGDGEYASYYIYDKRPYVTELRGSRSGGIYVLRFTEPWSLHRVAGDELRPLASGSSDAEEKARGLFAWRGRLYVLTRGTETVESEEEPTRPIPQVTDEHTRTVLLQAMEALELGRHVWALQEIDPRTGERLRRLELPTSAARLTLVPGGNLWAAIEETAAPNLGEGEGEGEGEGGSRTTLVLWPASEFEAGRFTCQPLEP